MNRTRLLLITALLGVGSSIVVAATDPVAESTRSERMDKAYEDYRNPQPGPVARTESSIKRGAHRTGEAIESGAKKVGHAVGKGVRKTGEVIGRGGEKLEDASAPKP
jgi:hypothetical protein